MNLFLIDMAKQKSHLLLFTLLLSVLAGRVQAESVVRAWLDENTAVTVTAQKNVSVFAQRMPLPSDGSYLDFAGVGLFEVNQMGKRYRYLSLLVWSTQLRSEHEQTKFEDRFETFVILADDQPLTFKRYTRSYETLLLSAPVFKYPGATRREMFYQISLEQLTTLAAAKKLQLAPTANTDGEQTLQPVHDALSAIVTFANEVSKTNLLMKPGMR